MNDFSDISQGLNFEGRYDFIRNFQVSNGIFSAVSTTDQSAQFYLVWPGYPYEMLMGKVGGPITVAQRAGQNMALAQMLMWYFFNGMTVP